MAAWKMFCRKRLPLIRVRCRFSNSSSMLSTRPAANVGFLTFAAYRALGGLEGAIASRADEVIDALDGIPRTRCPVVLRALTTVRQADEAITASPALLEHVAVTPAQLPSSMR